MPLAGIDPALAADVFRVLDKLDKIGIEKVRKELTTGYKDESGDTIAGVGLQMEQVSRIETFLDALARAHAALRRGDAGAARQGEGRAQTEPGRDE